MSNNKKKNKKTKKKVLKTFERSIVPIFVALLTAFFSFQIMKVEIQKNNDYWKYQMMKNYLIGMLDDEIDYYKEINSSILELQILSKEIKSKALNLTIQLSSKSNLEKIDLALHEFEITAIEYHKKGYELIGLIETASLYFGSEYSDKFNEMISLLEVNYSTNLIIEEYEIEKLPEIISKIDTDPIEHLNDLRIEIMKDLITKIEKDYIRIFDLDDLNGESSAENEQL